METNPGFDKYMDQYYDFPGQWESPSRCGLRIIYRKDGNMLAIATEIYRQNPGTAVTEWVAPLATGIMKKYKASPDLFIFIEHTPDLKSKLTFYGETFDLVSFDWDGDNLVSPRWTRLSRETVDVMMEE
jgi:hypothetical protein